MPEVHDPEAFNVPHPETNAENSYPDIKEETDGTKQMPGHFHTPDSRRPVISGRDGIQTEQRKGKERNQQKIPDPLVLSEEKPDRAFVLQRFPLSQCFWLLSAFFDLRQ